MADDRTLQKHLGDFQIAVKRLGDTVNKSGIEWKDAQFANLSNSIKGVAASSRQVLVIGGQCTLAIKRFNTIESEQ